MVCSVSLFILQLAHCFGFAFRLCVSVSFNPNCLILFLSSSVCLVFLLLFVLFSSVFGFFYVWVFPCFCFCLIDFVSTISQVFFLIFSIFIICFYVAFLLFCLLSPFSFSLSFSSVDFFLFASFFSWPSALVLSFGFVFCQFSSYLFDFVLGFFCLSGCSLAF